MLNILSMIFLVCAEAQVCAREAVESGNSDDDDRDFNFKRASNGEGNRKRRVVFDFSDEEDEYKDVVSLASPDPPKSKSSLDSKQSSKASVVEKSSLNFNELKEAKPKEKEEKYIRMESNQLLREESLDVSKGKNNGISSSDKIHSSNSEKDACTKDKLTGAAPKSSSIVSKGKNSGISSSNKIQSCIPEEGADAKDKVTDAAPNSPKRRKVLKTRIDERGREGMSGLYLLQSLFFS